MRKNTDQKKKTDEKNLARVKGMTLEPNWMPTDMGFLGRNYSANQFVQ